jgi:internalin A
MGLESLTQLKGLGLNDNQLTDVKSLEKLTKLTWLGLGNNKLTDVKGLEKLTQLVVLLIEFNPDLPKAQIDALQKALPTCTINSELK